MENQEHPKPSGQLPELVHVSQQALESAAIRLDKVGHSEGSSNKTLSQLFIPPFNPRDMEEDEREKPSGQFPLLQTASGKIVHVSQQALESAAITLDRVGPLEGSTIKTLSQPFIPPFKQRDMGENEREKRAGQFPLLQTASGKIVHVSQQALKAAAITLDRIGPLEGSTIKTLSQPFIPPFKPKDMEENQRETDVGGKQQDEFMVTATRVNPPTFYLPDKKCFVSKKTAQLMGDNAWNSEMQGGKTLKPPLEAASFFGTHSNDGSNVKVGIWQSHGEFSIQEGMTYKLSGFKRGDRNELWSSAAFCVSPLDCNPSLVPGPACLRFDQIFEIAHSTTANQLVDFVAKVTKVHANGHDICVEDVEGRVMKLKFQFGIQREGFGSVLLEGKIAAFYGMEVVVSVTKRRGILFSTQYTLMFDNHPMPNHLVEGFELLSAAVLFEDDDDGLVPGISGKRGRSPSAEDEEKKRMAPC